MMKYTLLVPFVLLAIHYSTPADGFLASAISNFGGNSKQTSNCPGWSEFSTCFSTSDRTFWDRLPTQCYQNHLMALITGAGRPTVNKIMDYAERLNKSATACGFCNIQVSCSPQCSPAPGENNIGISDKICQLPTESQACTMTPEAYDADRGECHIWPPRDTSPESFFGPIVPEMYQTQLWALKPLNCISIGTKCYCCCAPYFVNPCDAQCTLTPCSLKTAFTGSEVVAVRDSWLRSKGK